MFRKTEILFKNAEDPSKEAAIIGKEWSFEEDLKLENVQFHGLNTENQLNKNFLPFEASLQSTLKKKVTGKSPEIGDLDKVLIKFDPKTLMFSMEFTAKDHKGGALGSAELDKFLSTLVEEQKKGHMSVSYDLKTGSLVIQPANTASNMCNKINNLTELDNNSEKEYNKKFEKNLDALLLGAPGDPDKKIPDKKPVSEVIKGVIDDFEKGSDEEASNAFKKLIKKELIEKGVLDNEIKDSLIKEVSKELSNNFRSTSKGISNDIKWDFTGDDFDTFVDKTFEEQITKLNDPFYAIAMQYVTANDVKKAKDNLVNNIDKNIESLNIQPDKLNDINDLAKDTAQKGINEVLHNSQRELIDNRTRGSKTNVNTR